MSRIPGNLDGHRNAAALTLHLLTGSQTEAADLILSLPPEDLVETVLGLGAQAAGYVRALCHDDDQAAAGWLRDSLARLAALPTPAPGDDTTTG